MLLGALASSGAYQDSPTTLLRVYEGRTCCHEAPGGSRFLS